jgi:DNA-binding transcriptional ArsR family regulator
VSRPQQALASEGRPALQRPSLWGHTEPGGSVFPSIQLAFAALSDATRRGILERLGRTDASISELAASFWMTLTGIKKHVRILERSRLVTTEKVGRVRHCRLGPRSLEEETAWIAQYRQMLEARLDRLGEFLERTKGSES